MPAQRAGVRCALRYGLRRLSHDGWCTRFRMRTRPRDRNGARNHDVTPLSHPQGQLAHRQPLGWRQPAAAGGVSPG